MSTPAFAVSEFTTWHQTFEEDVALYQRLGVDAIEICERKLSRDPAKAKEQLAYLKETGLKVSSIQPRVHALFPDFMCPDVLEPEARMEIFKASIDLFAAFFPDTALVTITGNAPNHNYQLAHQTARRLYAELADYAAAKNMKLMFEPLNPILMNNDSFICTLEQGLHLINAVKRENFGLMLDVWHIWHEPLILERLAALKHQIFGVHISDWPKDEPRAPGDRLIPGEGCIDLPGLLASIEASGYDEAYCLEIFSADHLPDSLWQQEPASVIVQSRQGFYKAWEARHA